MWVAGRCITTKIILLSIAFSLRAGADTVVLNSSKDNTLYDSGTGDLSNGVGEYMFAGRTNGAPVRRAVLAFDLIGIPAGSVITDVELTLHMSKSLGVTSDVTLHRLVADWGEGSSDAPLEEGSGSPATTGDATWLHRFFTTQLWASAGGDFVATASATESIGAISPYTWSGAGVVSDVQGWLNNPTTNFGWILIGNEDVTQTALRFNTRENGDAGTRPELSVTFTPPAAQTFYFSLDGALSGTASTARGAGRVTLNSAQDELFIEVLHDVVNTSNAHIHNAAAGGAIVFGLPFTNPISATWNTITPTQVAALLAGSYYVNVHSSTFPAGEIRGSINPASTTPFDLDNDGVNDFSDGSADPDNDGLLNFLDADSDNDGVNDGTEVALGLDPFNPSQPDSVPLYPWALATLVAVFAGIGASRKAIYSRGYSRH